MSSTDAVRGSGSARVVVNAFGGPSVLELERSDTVPSPGPDEVVVQLTSVGMNHADLMIRRGEYRIRSGQPPFTPGLEGGGYIHSVGQRVTDRTVGQRVALCLTAPPRQLGEGGTYRTHFVVRSDLTIPAPDCVPDVMLGALWQAFLTPWSCLVWKHRLERGCTVLLPAASSSVAIGASQVLKDVYDCKIIGATRGWEKATLLREMPEARYDEVITTNDPEWPARVKEVTGNRGVDVIFDPVAGGELLNREIRLLATNGTIFVYGLLAPPGLVDTTPLIRKRGTIRGWGLAEFMDAGPEALELGYRYVFDRLENRRFHMPIAAVYSLSDVVLAHQEMERSLHIGKLVISPLRARSDRLRSDAPATPMESDGG